MYRHDFVYTGIDTSGSAAGIVKLCACYLTGYIGCRVPIQVASTLPGVARQHREDKCAELSFAQATCSDSVRGCRPLMSTLHVST